jgi:hypothetical protein
MLPATDVVPSVPDGFIPTMVRFVNSRDADLTSSTEFLDGDAA